MNGFKQTLQVLVWVDTQIVVRLGDPSLACAMFLDINIAHVTIKCYTGDLFA